ncbi:MAG TPA: hypothetical protein VFF16_06620, partial [Telluria sp.]|nr:hypothetical protein [Telluria sp.]
LPFACMAALLFGLSAWLYLFKLENILVQVEDSRLRFTLDDLRADFEKALDRGFRLAQLTNAQAALDTELRQDPDLAWLCVLDARGAVIFKSGAGAPPALILPPGATAARDRQGITLAVPLQDDTGAAAGALAMRYSSHARDRIVAALTLRLALAAVCATVFTSTVFAFALRRLRARAARLLDQAAEALHEPRVEAELPPPAATLTNEVRQTAATALVEITAARHSLSAGEATG